MIRTKARIRAKLEALVASFAALNPSEESLLPTYTQGCIDGILIAGKVLGVEITLPPTPSETTQTS